MEEKKLTQEQERLVLDHIDYAKKITTKVIRTRGLKIEHEPLYEIENLYGIAMYALVRAALKYDPENGALFTTYSYEAIVHELNSFLDAAVKIKKGDEALGHIDREHRERIKDSGSHESFLIEGSFTMDIEPLINKIANDVSLSISRARLQEDDYITILRYIGEGYKYVDIAKLMGVSVSTIYDAIKKIKKTCNNPAVKKEIFSDLIK